MRLRAALLGLLAGTALAVPAGPAAAAACADRTSVTVVVDFAALGGGEQTRCTGSDPSSGLAALRAAGFTPTRAAQQPGYFVCRINGKPASDPCQRTSPADAYWSYWHAQRGGSWTYSSMGAADYDPPPGTVEGWAFGAGKPPSSPPPPRAAAAPAPSRTASPRPPAASTPPTAAASASASSAALATTASTAAPSASPPATTPAASPRPSPSSASAQPSPDPTPSVLADLPPITPARSSGSGPLLAAVLVAALVAAAVTTGVRRRRQAGG